MFASVASEVAVVAVDRFGLEHHHAHGVADDVVELACDAGALIGHRDACRRLSLALGERRARG